MIPGLIIDLFAGGGGASLGIEAALQRPVNYAINHDPVALDVHQANHPETIHLTTDIWRVKPLDVTHGRPVDVLWASPDCKHHSRAKGGKPLDKKIRFLAWSVYRWAHDVRPAVIFLENVPEFREWGPLGEDCKPIVKRKGESFRRWYRQIERLGYVVEHRILNAADYGAPTSRKRLFLVARLDGAPIRWPSPTHGMMGLPPYRTAAECIDWSLPCPSIFGRTLKDGRPDDLADNTLRRIAEGIRRFVLSGKPFVVPVAGQLAAPALIQTSYGEREGQRPRVLDLHQPLGTIVAGGIKHSLVAAFLVKHFKGVVGVPFDGRPLDTVTTWDHHSLAVAQLSPGVSHAAEVRAFLTAYYGSIDDHGQALTDPTRTIPTKDRFALVTVQGVEYAIEDIGMRMLSPEELLRAQFGSFAATYDLTRATTKEDKVRLIGNSVCPEVARALVAANLRGAA